MGQEEKNIEHLIEKILDILNPSWGSDPDMRETPNRVARMYLHFFRDCTDEELDEQINKVFPTKNDQMVIQKNIECFGLCPHHLLPIVYKVHIGYLPDGWAIGLSKLPRLATMLSSYPKLQENFTHEIADTLEHKLKPAGIMVVVEGLHGCIRCRGVEQDSVTITSDCRGLLRLNSDARHELLSLIK